MSSDSLQLDEHLARLLAAYDPGLDGGDAKAGTVAVPPLGPSAGERLLGPISTSAVNELGFDDVLPDATRPLRPVTPVPTPAPVTGGTHRIGRFELRRQLGKGGCGIVFLAYDPTLKREVALKIPRPELLLSADARRRLLREALAAAEFDHPNLVPVYETGEIGPVCFIATAFCPGQTLAEWLAKQSFPVPIRQAARLVGLLAEAVHHAHDRGVLHRDLKPNNIILQKATPATDDEAEPAPGSCPLRGDHFVPRVVDFGLAKLAERGPSDTASRQVLGTPKYMAPEQALARHDDIGPAADVYALGVILYEMVAGRAPYEGDTDVAVLRQAVDGLLTAPRAYRADLPRDLEAICLKAMAKSPSRRYRTALDLADDVRRFLDGRPTVARPLKWAGRASRWVRRNDQAVALGIVTAIALFFLGAAAVNAVQGRRLKAAEEAAIRKRAEQLRIDRQRDHAVATRAAFLAWRGADPDATADALAAARGPMVLGSEQPGFAHAYLSRLARAGRWAAAAPGPVVGLTLSADGKRLTAAHPDGTATAWDADTGKPLGPADPTDPGAIPDGPWAWHGPDDAVRAVVASTDGRTVFTATAGGVVRSWDAAQTADVAARTHAARVTAVAAAPDGTGFAVAFADGAVHLYMSRSAPPRVFAAGGRKAVVELVYPADGPPVGVEVAGRTAVVWAFADDPRAVLTATPTDGATVARVALTAGRLAVADDRGRVTVWEPGRPTPTWGFDPGTGRPATALAISPSGRQVATPAGDDLGVWDAEAAGPVARFMWAADGLTAVRFFAAGDRVAVAGRGGAVRVWEVATGRAESLFVGHAGRVTGLAAAPDGRTLATADAGGWVRLWDVRAGIELVALRRHAGPVPALGFAADGKLLVTGGSAGGGGETALWDAKD